VPTEAIRMLMRTLRERYVELHCRDETNTISETCVLVYRYLRATQQIDELKVHGVGAYVLDFRRSA
jgi:hypothetical protein